MVSEEEVTYQMLMLGKIAPKPMREEIRLSCSYIEPGEEILGYCEGIYRGKHALMMATNSRLMIIDKSSENYLIENLNYDQIYEIDKSSTPLKKKISLYLGARKLVILTKRGSHSKSFISLLQSKIIETDQFSDDQIVAAVS